MRIVLTGLLTGLLAGCQLIVVADPKVQAPEPVEVVQAEITPIKGSEKVGFMDHGSSQLLGCRQLSRMKISMRRSFEDTLVEMRNRAHMMGASMMAPVRLYQTGDEYGVESHDFIVDLLRCPENVSSQVTTVRDLSNG